MLYDIAKIIFCFVGAELGGRFFDWIVKYHAKLHENREDKNVESTQEGGEE